MASNGGCRHVGALSGSLRLRLGFLGLFRHNGGGSVNIHHTDFRREPNSSSCLDYSSFLRSHGFLKKAEIFAHDLLYKANYGLS